jgi:hypothetical protein
MTFTTLVSDSFTGANQQPLDPTKWLDPFKNTVGGDDTLQINNHVLETTVSHFTEQNGGANGEGQNLEANWLSLPDQWMELKVVSMGVSFTTVTEYLRQGVWDKSYNGTAPDPATYRFTLFTDDGVNYAYIVDSLFKGDVQGFIWANRVPVTFTPGDVFRFAVKGQHSNGGHLYLYQNGNLLLTGNLSLDSGDISSGSPAIELDAQQQAGGSKVLPSATDVQVINFNAGTVS